MIQKLLGLVSTVLSWLPTSPFADVASDFQSSLGLAWLNWFIPVGRMVEVTAAWCTAIALYYLASIMLRWVKAIQ